MSSRKKEYYQIITAFCVLMSLAIIFFYNEYTETRANSDTWIDPQYVKYCNEIGEEYGICPEILIAIIESESSGKANVISSAGCVGLCQLNPKYCGYTRQQLLDPKTNIRACAEHLLVISEDSGDDIGLALVAYNCGLYSKTYKNCKATGQLTKYATKITTRAESLERLHNK